MNGKNNDLNFIGNAALLPQINLVDRFFVVERNFLCSGVRPETHGIKKSPITGLGATYFCQVTDFQALAVFISPALLEDNQKKHFK